MRIDLTDEEVAALSPHPFKFTTASMDVFELCPASGVFRGPKSEPTGAHWYGIFVHRFLEYAINRTHKEAIDYIKTKRNNKAAVRCCLSIDIESLPLGEAEVGYALGIHDDEIRRLYGVGTFGMRDVDAYGKADFVFYEGDGTPHVTDWKCGWLDGDPREQTQLLGLAAAVRAESGASSVKVSLTGVESTGALHWNTTRLESAHIDHFVGRMRRVHLRMQRDREAWNQDRVVPEFVPGEHCSSCWCREVCPAAKREGTMKL